VSSNARIEPEALGVLEVARRLGVHPGTVYGAVAAKQIPSVRVGGRILISRRWLDEQLGGGSQPKADQAAETAEPPARDELELARQIARRPQSTREVSR
jgi:excisionase family DNA binding protein